MSLAVLQLLSLQISRGYKEEGSIAFILSLFLYVYFVTYASLVALSAVLIFDKILQSTFNTRAFLKFPRKYDLFSYMLTLYAIVPHMYFVVSDLFFAKTTLIPQLVISSILGMLFIIRSLAVFFNIGCINPIEADYLCFLYSVFSLAIYLSSEFFGCVYSASTPSLLVLLLPLIGMLASGFGLNYTENRCLADCRNYIFLSIHFVFCSVF